MDSGRHVIRLNYSKRLTSLEGPSRTKAPADLSASSFPPSYLMPSAGLLNQGKDTKNTDRSSLGSWVCGHDRCAVRVPSSRPTQTKSRPQERKFSRSTTPNPNRNEESESLDRSRSVCSAVCLFSERVRIGRGPCRLPVLMLLLRY